MSARDSLFLACFAAMFLSLCCAVVGVPLLVCLVYFVIPLAVMAWACFD